MSKPKLFISYAHEDELHLKQLTNRVKGLERQELIESWSDNEILPGMDWDDEIKSQLADADVIIFLISPDFIASEYIHKVELKNAVKRHNESEVIIIPVVIRPCDFSSLEIKKFQALPKGAKPISKWEDKDDAWLDVLQGIKKVINNIDKILKKRVEKPANTNEDETGKEDEANLKMKIASGEMDEAIDELLKITKEKGKDDLYNSMIMQSSKYTRAKKEYSNDLLTLDQYKRSIAKIENALLAIADELGLD